MLMNWLAQKVIVTRAQEYVQRYQPLLIGISGGLNQTVLTAALHLILDGQRYLRASAQPFKSAPGAALDILGMRSRNKQHNWWHILTRSRLQELVAAEPDTVAVELGPKKPGDIDQVAQWFKFDIGLVMGVPATRLDLFGDHAMVAHEISSLIVGLPSSGIALLNTDDPAVAAMRGQTAARVLTFGRSPAADVRLKHVQRQGTGFSGEVAFQQQSAELYLPFLTTTEHVTAALGALALTIPLKLNLTLAANRLSKLVPPPGHSRLLAGQGGSRLIDGSADIFPEEAIAGLDALRELPARRRIAVLGDIVDLSAHSRSIHRELGHRAGLIADMVIVVGDAAAEAGAEALRQQKADVHHFKTSRAAGKWLADYMRADDLVFITGSSVMKMENITARLLADPVKDAHHLPRKILF